MRGDAEGTAMHLHRSAVAGHSVGAAPSEHVVLMRALRAALREPRALDTRDGDLRGGRPVGR